MQAGSAAKTITLRVGRTDGPPSKFASLAEALEDLPKEGGIVELVGDGPFVLAGIRIEGREKIVVTAAENSHPVVLLAATVEVEDAPALSMAGGTLILSDIHLVAVGELFPGDQPRRLVNVEGGDLVVRNCSVTMQGSREIPLVAFRVSGSSQVASTRPHGEPHVLLDRVLVRGENLTAIDLNLPAVDLLASGCFFATGRAPVLRVTSTSDARGITFPGSVAKSSSDRDSTVARALRIFSCTTCGSRNAFELMPGSDLLNPPETEVQLLNSIIACEKGSNESVLISLRDWQDETADNPRKSQLKNLRWTIDHSLTLGWKTLLQKDLGKNRAVRDVAAWQQVWRNSVDSVQFQPLPWPGREITDFAMLNPGKLEIAVPGTQGIRATDGERPGCDPEKLAMPQQEILARATAYAERPVVPADLIGASAAGMTRKIDLDAPRASDLGKAISAAGDWPSGTVFLVSGSGIKTSSPIRVKGKSLRIEFDEKSRGRLTIQAAPAEEKLTESNGEGAFLSVAQGSLELIHTNFKSQLSARKTETAWLVKVSDGNLSIHNSVLTGQLLENPGDEGLVRWATTEGTAANPTGSPGKFAAGAYHHFAHISESYLVARGVILSVDAHNRGVLLDQSLCVSGGRLFDVHLVGHDPRIHGAFDVSACTLSAGQAFFHVRGGTLGAASPSPMRFFVEQTAFAPSLISETTTSQAAAVLICDGFKPSDGLMEWWENANGYSASLQTFLAPASPAGQAAPDNTTVARADWPGFWGTGHVERPLLDDDGTILNNPKQAKLTEQVADDFRLLANSKATTWTVDGSSIGVNIDALPALALKGGIPKPAPKPTKVEKSKPTKKSPTF